MRILENEHRYLSYLMNEWHTIVLNLQNFKYGIEQARQEFTRLRQLIDAFKVTFEQHTKKEERFFFPLLGKFIGYEQGPLLSIEHEHEEITAYLEHFLYHSAGEHSYSLSEMSTISRDAGEAFEILTIHFVKEESILFPMTVQVMNEADQHALSQQLHTLII